MDTNMSFRTSNSRTLPPLLWTASEFLHHETTDHVTWITLLGVDLDDNTLVRPGPVPESVLGFVVGVDRMSHVGGNLELSRNRLVVSGGSGRVVR